MRRVIRRTTLVLYGCEHTQLRSIKRLRESVFEGIFDIA